MDPNLLTLLDEIRSIGKTGLHYAVNDYDRERYQRLLDLAASRYTDLSGQDLEDIARRIRRGLGPDSPKVAVAAAIFSDDDRILLIRRHDDRKWGMPAGLGEVFESPLECAVRETREETTLEVEAEGIIDVFCRRAGDGGLPFTTWTIMVHCRAVRGEPSPTEEALEVGYFGLDEVPENDWHRGTKDRVARALAYRREKRP